jgi:broad specificity phosphatase PhoE
MQFLELRRHSLRVRPNEHLSQAGVTLARRVGDRMGAFARVITSLSPRAFETAIAMGYAVDERYEPVTFTAAEWKHLGEHLPEGTPFEERARVMRAGGLSARYARELAQQWQSIAERLPDRGRGLVISHGGYLDDSAVACMPQAEYKEWGENFAHCEGIRLQYDEGRFVACEILRVRKKRDL